MSDIKLPNVDRAAAAPALDMRPCAVCGVPHSRHSTGAIFSWSRPDGHGPWTAAAPAPEQRLIGVTPCDCEHYTGEVVICKHCQGRTMGNRELDALRARPALSDEVLRQIVAAYDTYRARGVMPAPEAYQALVKAIESARTILKR